MEPSNVTSNIPFKKKTSMFDNFMKFWNDLSDEAAMGFGLLVAVVVVFSIVAAGVLLNSFVDGRRHERFMECVKVMGDAEGCRRAIL